jgi:hypothetical protein
MTDQYPTEPQPSSGPQSGSAGWGQPGYQPPLGSPPLGPKPPQRPRAWILVLVGVGAVLAIVAFVVIAATSDDSPTLKQAAPTTDPASDDGLAGQRRRAT